LRVPRRLLLVGIVAALGVAVYIFWTPLEIRYRLWRTRAGDSTSPSRPHLCDIGPDALDPVLAAFEEDGADPEMSNLRQVTAHTLRCLRRDRAAAVVGSRVAKDVAYADLPLDPPVEVIARAFLAEPQESKRAQMKLYLDELDFRARFRVYALLMAGPYPVPTRMPTADPYERYPTMVPEPLRQAWCAEVAPVARPILAGKSKRTFAGEETASAATELMANRCEPGDIDLLIQLAADNGASATPALLALMTNPDRARIDRVFARSTPCPVVDRFYSALLQRQAPLREEAARAFHQVDISCLDRRCPRSVKDCRSYLHERLLAP
jgi:hypothetical protein